MLNSAMTANESHILEEEVHGKKRWNEESWKKNARKKLRAQGEEYTTARNKVSKKRETGTDCR